MQAKTLVFVMAVAALFISHAYGQTGTTAVAAGTTAVAAGTTAVAAGTTAAPAGTTAAPAGTTAAPAGTTAAPANTTAAPAGTTAAPAGTTAGVTWVALGSTSIVFQQYTNNVCNVTQGANATHIPLSSCQVFTALPLGSSTFYATGQQLSTSWFYFGVAPTCSTPSITIPAQVQIQNGVCSWFNVTAGGVSNTVYVKAWWTIGSGGSTTAAAVAVTTTTGAVVTTAASATTSGASMLSVASSIALVFVGLLAALMA